MWWSITLQHIAWSPSVRRGYWKSLSSLSVRMSTSKNILGDIVTSCRIFSNLEGLFVRKIALSNCQCNFSLQINFRAPDIRERNPAQYIVCWTITTPTTRQITGGWSFDNGDILTFCLTNPSPWELLRRSLVRWPGPNADSHSVRKLHVYTVVSRWMDRRKGRQEGR